MPSRPRSTTSPAPPAAGSGGPPLEPGVRERIHLEILRRTGAYRTGDQGYTDTYGPRDGYKNNYRAGFRRGYEDGYRARTR